MITKTQPKPKGSMLEYEGFALRFKSYLQSHSFSYRCDNYRTQNCPYLVTIPIEGNYDYETWACIKTQGAYRSSTQYHSDQCKKLSNMMKNQLRSPENSQHQSINSDSMESLIEWSSDCELLRTYIMQHPALGPKSIKTQMEKFKQRFSLRVIKDMKKEILGSIFPKDRQIAFFPSNYVYIGFEDACEDNLFKYHGQILTISKDK